MLYFCSLWRYCQNNYKNSTLCKTKDKQDEAQRHAQRDALISKVFRVTVQDQVESIQNPFVTSLPYEQIYAEARYLIETGFQYWFDLDDIETLEAHNDDFRAQENEEQLLAVYFDIPTEGSGTFMTTAEISDKLVIKGSIKKPMPLNRLGMVLKKARYTQKCLGGKVRGWLVRECDADEVNANRRINAKL